MLLREYKWIFVNVLFFVEINVSMFHLKLLRQVQGRDGPNVHHSYQIIAHLSVKFDHL